MNKNELTMSDYEILRKTKIAYEYINNILNNSNIKIDDNIVKDLENTMKNLSIIYSNAHSNLEHPDKEEQLLTDACCKNCSNKLYISENIDHSYQCLECDENFYDFETDVYDVWYENKKKETAKFPSSFNLNIEYDNDEKRVFIGSEDGCCCKYSCHNLDEFVKSLEFYCNNYLKEEYTIEIWETDWHRDVGEGYIYDESFSNYDDAISKARKLYYDNGYSSIEVLNENRESVFCCDNLSEDFYFDDDEFSLVDKNVVKEYIENWTNKKEQSFKADKLYCQENNIYVAVDNSTNNCWVEEFKSEKDAQNWLLGKDLEKGDYENEI